MSFLPITKKDYNTAVLMADFIAKMRDSLESNNTLKFTPLINGCKIDFVVDNKQFNILLDFNKKIKTELIINVFINEVAEKAFKSVSAEDNERIIKEILK